jgi:glycosyltransferase involved in cell wall biosynthesis
MRICLVTAFPPSTQRLNEYGLHLAQQARELGGDLVILADDYAPRSPELPAFDVRRCWAFNDLRNPLHILKAARAARADVVWFNLVYSTFGDHPLAAFIGLCTPLLLRIAGFRTHVTLHHLMENVELRHADIRFPRLYLWAGSLATSLLLQAHQVSVLLERYRSVLEKRYKAVNINVRRHGILGFTPVRPNFVRRRQQYRILAFGKFGRYKRLEVMLEAFPRVRAAVPGARLVIAGQDHPNRPGYMAALAEQYKNDPDIEFLGYLPEDGIAPVFRRCNVCVLPYSSSGGPSGVAHQAAQFGLPIVGADIEDIRNVADEEGLAVDYYRTGDAAALADRLIALARDPDRERRMAEQNFEAALGMTMPEIVAQYLNDFARGGAAAEVAAGALPDDRSAAA